MCARREGEVLKVEFLLSKYTLTQPELGFSWMHPRAFPANGSAWSLTQRVTVMCYDLIWHL